MSETKPLDDATATSGAGRPRSAIAVLSWFALAVYLVAVVALAWNPTPIAHGLAFVLVALSMAHAILAYGRVNALAFLAICLATTFAIENVGVATGFPFGRYHFATDLGLPRIGAIPIIVGPLWFGMGYISWSVAGVLLDDADRRLDDAFNVIALPIVAAFVMTQWDMVMDPPGATLGKAWIWHDGGGYFGVPLSNFLGWFLTTWLFCQAFAIYMHRRSRTRAPPREQSLALRSAPVLFYLCAGLTHVTPFVIGTDGEAIDAAGRLWRVHDVREATVAAMLFTMLFTSMVALLRIMKTARSPASRAGQ